MVGICRLCASLRKQDVLITITDDNQEICCKLRQCCQVQISVADALPKSICEDCVRMLQMAYTFYTRVHESQESLQTLFPSTPSVKEVQSSDAATLAERLSTTQDRTQESVDDESVESPIAQQLQDNKDLELEMNVEVEVSKVPEKKEVKAVPLDIEETQLQEAALQNSEYTVAIEDTDGSDGLILIEQYITNDEDVVAGDENNSEQEKELLETEEKASATLKEVTKEPHTDDEEIELILTLSDLEVASDDGDDEMHEEHLDKSTVLAGSLQQVNEWRAYTWHCYLCAQTVDSFPELKLHALTIHAVDSNQMQYKCTDCQKICKQYCMFLNHVRIRHHTALALRCDVCDAASADYKQLARHSASCNSNNDSVYAFPEVQVCDVCGKVFRNLSALRMHKKVQHSTATQRKFACTHCEKKFKCSSALRAHQRVHSDKKEFACDQCGRAFRHKVNLDMHMYSHVNDKPYECTLCKKNFKTSINLEKHALLHADIRQFKCDYCEKAFRTKDAKLSHERTHTGEMPYQCEYCERRFRFRSTFMGHLNTHTGKRPHSCLECNHHFTNWSNYNKHMKRRHSATSTKKGNAAAKSLKKTKQTTVEIENVQNVADVAIDDEVIASFYNDDSDQILDAESDVELLQEIAE